MILTAKGFRGISDVNIETAKITLIAAPNYQGKTSAMQCAAAILSGVQIPVEDVPKKDCWMLLKDGEKRAEISVEIPNVGAATLTYPDCNRITEGDFFEISEYAAGLKSLVNYSQKDRAQLLVDLLNAYPTAEQLNAELVKIGIVDPEAQKALWRKIETLTWDGAHKEVSQKGTKIKGQWEETSGERFGTAKCKSWLPAEWESDLETTTEETLKAELQKAQDWLDVVKSDSAVSEAETIRLKKLADMVPNLKQCVEQKTTVLHGLEVNRSAIEEGIANLPTAQQPETIECPHCQGKVSYAFGKLVIPQILTDEELKARQKNIDECRASLKKVVDEINTETEHLRKLQSELKISEDAARDLTKVKKRRKGEVDPKEKLPELEAALERAKGRLSAWEKKNRADKLIVQFEQNQKIVALLAPDGLRLVSMKSALGGYNAELKKICTLAKWATVEVKSDMSITMGNRYYSLLSESEQFRVRVALQVAAAVIDGSKIVLIDGADILDKAGRNGLFRVLMNSELEAVVAMTIDDIDQVPDLSKIDGVSYWIESGVSKALSR